MKLYRKAILPLGFKASGISSGVKKSGKLDLALFYSDIPAKAACEFTTNKIQAAPIQLDKIHLKKSKSFQAIIVNSGNANCFTGKSGLRDSIETAQALAKTLSISKENVLVASTGIIGRKLPLLKIKRAIPELVQRLSKGGINKAKVAIMTTDTFSKEMTLEFNLGRRRVRICGIAKGVGMIAPSLASPRQHRGATLLVFIFTDALISQQALNKALKVCVDNSFNCITVDGCMSTNDSVIMLANGQAQNVPIKNQGGSFNTFAKALQIVCRELAKMIIQDAEGASKFIRIRVNKAKSFTQAIQVAKAVANSNLFKTAIYGENHNFGRIVASIGASGIDVKEEEIKIRVSPLKKKEIKVEVFLNQGDGSATVYTSDLTPEYIKINAEYN